MKTVGVIVEYNPFHFGHAYHIEMVKKTSGADVVIAVMSGNFLQRGEPALVSKWSRTKMALAAGVDLVIELPYAFATQRADVFADGGIAILTALACDAVCFGSEAGEISSFYDTYNFSLKNDDEIQRKIKEAMQAGNSYPQAVADAYTSVLPSKELLDLSQPNNMLGFQYISAAKRISSSIEFFTIQRKDAHFHEETFSSERIASATSIRKSLHSDEGQLRKIEQYVPITTFATLQSYKETYGQFHQWENYWPLLQYQLLQNDAKQLERIYEMEEGLENRFQTAAVQAHSFHHFMQLVKTKRYTWTRLQRAAVHLLTQTTKEEMIANGNSPAYLRLLGFSNTGRAYLNKIKHNLPIPLISKLAAAPREMTLLDRRAASIFSLGLANDKRPLLLKEEYEHPPIFYR